VSGAPLSFTRKERENYVGFIASRAAMRFCLAFSVAVGTVSLTSFSVLFSVMDTPASVFHLLSLAFETYHWTIIAVCCVVGQYFLSENFKRRLNEHASNMTTYDVTNRDIRQGAMPPAFYMLLLVVGLIITKLDQNYLVLSDDGMSKIIMCDSVHHTLMGNPTYKLSEKITAFDCPLPDRTGEKAG